MSPDASFFMPPKYLEKQRTHKPHMQHKFPYSQYKLAYFFHFGDLRARFLSQRSTKTLTVVL